MTQAQLALIHGKHSQSISHPAAIVEDALMRKLIGAYDTLLDRFMPPSILVDEQWRVIDTFAGADTYLRQRSRRPTQSVMEMLGEPMRLAVNEAIDRICSGEHPVTIAHVQATDEQGCEVMLSVTVTMVPTGDETAGYCSISLEPIRSPLDYFESQASRANSRVRETTQNTDYEIGDRSLDMYLESAQLPVVFLDRELRIRRFTSHAGQMFNLVQHDIGREIRTFAGVLEVPDLIDRIRAVVQTGDPDEVEIHQPRHDKFFIARISPHRHGDEIDGAVLTLIDLSHLEKKTQEFRLLSGIVKSTDDAIISRDRDNRIITWNAAAEDLFGYSAAEAIGQNVSLIVPVDQEMDHAQTLRTLQKGGHLDHFNSVRTTKCGELIRVSVRLSPIYDHEHRVIGMSTIERDISRQCEALERLTASERKFQDFYNHSPVIYCSVDANTGTIVDCNDRMCQRLGFERREILGRAVVDLHSPQTRERARLCFEQFRVDGEVLDQELELVCSDGTQVPVLLNVTASRNDDGRVIRGRTVWQDISLQKSREIHVRQSEMLYRNSFQNSAFGIAHIDLEGNYLKTNPRIAEILGYSAEELSELRFMDITHPDDLQKELLLRKELIAGKKNNYMIEKRYIHKLGHEVWAHLCVSLERDSHGEPVSCHSYVEDISARKQLESELRLAIAQRDQFLAMLSHELRNPLGAILNTCAVLNQGRELPKSMKQPVLIVTRQAQQMAELLDDLLDVSRITTGKIKLEKSPTTLSEIVDEAVESQQGLAGARQQRLIVTYADEPLHIFGDRSRLIQVVVNLLNNAIKYSGDGSAINVTLEKRGRSGVILVKDTGVGIEPELIESLFEMFAQKDSTLDRSGGGMGLGLHLVRKLVEFHTGRVFGCSEGVGKGTEFVVELPLSNRSRITRVSKDRIKLSKPQRPVIQKIVVVEDIADARNMLVQLLEADDFDVVAAADGEAGLNLILRERPDLAIVDIGLPKMDGYEVARRIRQEIPKSELILVALSGYGQDSDHDRAINAGFDVHLVKPLNQARLAMILGRG